MLDRSLLRFEADKLSKIADLSALAGGPCNDMVVDAQGRAYVGNFGYDRHAGEEPRTTCIARIDPDGRAVRGCGRSAVPERNRDHAGRQDAHRRRDVRAPPDGIRYRRRRVLEQPPRLRRRLDGLAPDGICLDAEGAIWVADPFGKRVVRVFDGGRVERTISDRRTRRLRLHARREGPPHAVHVHQYGQRSGYGTKRDGRIDFMRVDVPGAGLP